LTLKPRMHRRDFLKQGVLAAGSVAMANVLHSTCLAAENSPAKPRMGRRLPNLVYILADDLGYGDLSCLNPDSRIATPHLDKLASQGMIFTDAHSGSAVCTPTRYGLLTGRYCWRSRLKQSVLWPWDAPLIEPGRLTVGGLLKRHGYSTACIGKWHLGWDWPTTDGSRMSDQVPSGQWETTNRNAFGGKVDFSRSLANGPTTRGFDYYFGDDVPNFAPYCFIENDRTVGIPTAEKPKSMFGTPGPMIEGWRLEDVMPTLTKRAVAFIRARPGDKPFNKKEASPFFLYFPLTAPHTPIAPTKEFRGTSKAGAYGDYVQQVDWTVGQIMSALDETGQTENTLLIFTSDNGSPGRDGTNMNGPTNSVRKFGHNPSYIYRGIKADIWEGGHRVPFLAQWPGRIRPGSRCGRTICHTDLLATCASLVGEELPAGAGEDSFSILAYLRGAAPEGPVREAVVHHSINGVFAIRKGKWKFVDGVGSGGWSGKGDGLPGQLYDMKTDPAEQNNLYGDPEHKPIVTRLQSLLEAYKTQGRTRPRA